MLILNVNTNKLLEFDFWLFFQEAYNSFVVMLA